jgi:mRNA interferase MazF
MNEPRRGEVWLVDLGMAAKVRPCLVISTGATEQDRASDSGSSYDQCS